MKRLFVLLLGVILVLAGLSNADAQAKKFKLAVVMAAPIPCTSLEMTRDRSDGASPPVNEAAENTTRPIVKIFFWPKTSPALPISISVPASVIVYAP